MSKENLVIKLHVDVEPQKSYQLGYPIEKREIFYLSLVTDSTNCRELEKYMDIQLKLPVSNK